MTNIFEQASRNKLRFDSAKGLLSVEDLWDLPLESGTKASLDSIGISLLQKLNSTVTMSLVSDTKPADVETQVKLDIIKHVISVKKAERDAARDRTARAAEKQRLLELKAQKQDEQLKGLSEAEIDARIAALG